MTRSARAGLALLLVLLVWAPAAHADAPQPVSNRFKDSEVFGGLTAPTAVRFSPDGSVFVAEKEGKVLRFDSVADPTGEVVVDLDNEVVDWFDRGLLGMDLDPGFGTTNRRMYLLYSYDGAPEDTAPRGDDCAGKGDECVGSGKLVRVDLPALGQAQPSDFHTLIDHEWCQQFSSHSIGTVAYGPDGALYAGAGEGASFSQADWGQLGDPTVNPCGDPPAGKGNGNSIPTAEGGSLRSQDIRTPGDPTGLDGAIIRVNPTTGAPLPGVASGDANARRIAAYGFRNPFRFTFRPGTHEIWAGDVGQESTEEIDRITDASNGSQPNYGWPCKEGNTVAAAWQGLNLCKSLTSTVAPYFTYDHGAPVSADDGDNCPLSFGTVISGLSFRRPGGGWPASFDNGLFFTDFTRACIWFMPVGANGLPDPTKVELFAHGDPAKGGAGAVDLQQGPDGSLYYVYWNPAGTNDGAVHRIAFLEPHAVLTADPTFGADDPLTVHLDASGSSSPDAQPLDFAWDLDGDGVFEDVTDGASFDHQFPRGPVTVSVRVSDPRGLSDVAHVKLFPGDTPPRPHIDLPLAGAPYSVGDKIAFRGGAGDTQDGDEPAGRLHWQVAIAHCPQLCHIHPAINLGSVSSGSFVGPDHDLPSHLELTLTATDADGLAASVTREIDPRVATIRVATQPAGIPVGVLGRAPAPSPQQAGVIDGSSAGILAPATATVGGATWTFVRWDDGSVAPQRVVEVRGATTRTAIYAPPATPTVQPPVVEPAAHKLVVHLVAPRRFRLGGRLRVRLSCTVSCTATTAATLRGVPTRLRRVRISTRHLRAGRAVTLTLRLSPAQRAAVRRARHAVTLRLVTTARGANGRRVHARATIRLVP